MGLATLRNLSVLTANFMLRLTVLGSAFHELAHQLACYAVGFRVVEVKYVILNDPECAGYVRFETGPQVNTARLLLVGIAPLIMGAFVGTGCFLAVYLLAADGAVTGWEGAALLAAVWIAANALYHAVPSPADLRNVFEQPFNIWQTIPCYALALPIWILAYNYKIRLWGWTPWQLFVIGGSIYAATLDWPAIIQAILQWGYALHGQLF